VYISNLSIPNIQINTNVGNGNFFYAWGAQIVRGTTLTPYYPTINRTNTPRVDYTDGSCPTLLLEQAVGNRFLRSQEFANASWVKSNVTVTSDTEIAPNNLLQADTLTATANDGYITQNGTAAFSRSILSFYLKRKTGVGNITLETGNQSSIVSINSSTWTRVWCLNTNNSGTYSITSPGAYTITTTLPHNLITGDLVFIDCVGGGGADHAGIVTVTGANTFTTTSGAVAAGGGTANVYAAFGRIRFQTSGDEVYAWGAQLENIPLNLQSGYYEPSSYIPTTTATVTRALDFLSLYKIRENNLLNNTWSVFCDVKKIGGNQNDAIIGISDSISATPTNGIIVSGVPLFVTKRDAGVNTTIVATTVYQPQATAYFKILITCNNGIVETWIDGSKLSTTTLVNYQLLTLLESIASNGITRFKGIYGWNRVLNRTEIDLLFQYPYYNAGYTPTNNELQQIINRAYAEGFTLPSTTILGHCDTLITEMKNDGVWNVSDVYYNFAYNDITLTNWAKINWKNPYGGLGLATYVNSTIYQIKGIKTDNTGSYVNTNFSPTRATYNFTLNSAGRMFVIAEDSTFLGANYYDSGLGGGSNSRMFAGSSSNNQINTNAGLPVAFATFGVGLKSIQRDSATNVRLQNLGTLGAFTSNSTTMDTTSQTLSRVSGGGVNAVFANYWMGASINNTQIDNFRTYYNTYLTNIGLTAFA
jgi:hypothetical protein